MMIRLIEMMMMKMNIIGERLIKTIVSLNAVPQMSDKMRCENEMIWQLKFV